QYQHLGSLEFAKQLIAHAKVAVAPGIGFGQEGDQYVRFALIENEHRTAQAIHGLKHFFNL
ncbi:MAG TPA: alanine transaminase, partial [Blastocatellia bacterium]|nr:alanine transaminase [Blastocatellia bacterium]